MQVKFRQTTRNGCGSLSIANIFDDHRFTLELDKLPGERFADLNKKLLDFGFEIFIDCLFLTQPTFRAGNRLGISHNILFILPRKGVTKVIRETYAVPYLFTIANRKGRNPHMVAVVHNISDGLFHVIDSTKHEVMVLSFRDLVKKFHILSVSIFRLVDHQEHGNFVMMLKSELPHIFQPKG